MYDHLPRPAAIRHTRSDGSLRRPVLIQIPVSKKYLAQMPDGKTECKLLMGIKATWVRSHVPIFVKRLESQGQHWAFIASQVAPGSIDDDDDDDDDGRSAVSATSYTSADSAGEETDDGMGKDPVPRPSPSTMRDGRGERLVLDDELARIRYAETYLDALPGLPGRLTLLRPGLRCIAEMKRWLGFNCSSRDR